MGLLLLYSYFYVNRQPSVGWVERSVTQLPLLGFAIRYTQPTNNKLIIIINQKYGTKH